MEQLAADFLPTSHISLEKQYQPSFWLSAEWSFTSMEDKVAHETTAKNNYVTAAPDRICIHLPFSIQIPIERVHYYLCMQPHYAP